METMGMSYEDYCRAVRNQMRLKYESFQAFEPAIVRYCNEIPVTSRFWQRDIRSVFLSAYRVVSGHGKKEFSWSLQGGFSR